MRQASSSLAILLIPLAFPVAVQEGQQTHFGVEEEITRAVKIPKAVLRMLKKDERVLECIQEDTRQDEDIESWFKASAVDLNGDKQTDLVVKPENGCLLGANIGPFWIFRNTRKGYELTLKTHTLGLDILPERTNGYRDVIVSAASAVDLFGAHYKFDGRRYAPWKCWVQSIDAAVDGGGKGIRYFKCSADVEKPYR